MGSCFSSESPKGNAQQPQSHYNFETHDLDPLNYVPDDSIALVRDPHRIVSLVHFVADSVIESGGNHWFILLETGNSFVRLEISPGAYPGREGYIGRFDIIHHGYGLTKHHHKDVAILSSGRHSVADFLDTIVNTGNHHYEFTREGRGCTGWVRDQFYLFVEMGLLPPGREQDVETALTSAWVNGTSQGPWPITLGRYLRHKKGNKKNQTANRR